MNIAKTEEQWAENARSYLKAELRKAEVTYAELARRLKKHGLTETEASITNKLARGTFSATFFLAVLRAIGVEQVHLEDV